MTNFLSALLIFVFTLSAYAKIEGICVPKLTVRGPLTFDSNGDVQLMNSRLFGLIGKQFFHLENLEEAVRAYNQDKSDTPYFIKITHATRISIATNPDALSFIPEQGKPAVIMSNHNKGADLLGVAALASLKRRDVKIVLSTVLAGIPGMPENAIFIDTQNSSKTGGVVQQMTAHLENGGLLVIDPSGEITNADGSLDRWRFGVFTAAKNAKNADEIQYLSAYVEGGPSKGYAKARRLWDFPGGKDYYGRAATNLMNLRDTVNSVGATIDFTIGAPVSGAYVKSLRERLSEPKITEYFRLRTRLLKKKPVETKPARELAPIAEPLPTNEVMAEMAEKMEEIIDTKKGIANKGTQIKLAKGLKIPKVVNELGRLREQTFRTVGEGSGKALDIDEFDEYYLHLIANDKDKQQTMGAYRLGLVKDILAEKGLPGMYSAQLFNFSPELMGLMNKTIELGRSFVLPQYQRRPIAFQYLLKGIAKVMVNIKRDTGFRYEYLMGPVSISNAYNTNSKIAMMRFLTKFHKHPDTLATPKIPPQLTSSISEAEWDLLFKAHDIQNPDDFKGLDSLIADLEGKDIQAPPLLRIYSTVNAKYLAFNFDPQFNCYDGFIVVHVPSLLREVQEKFFEPADLDFYLKP